MAGFIRQDGSYYQGPQAVSPLDKEVPERPSATVVWNGTAWVEDPALVKVKSGKGAVLELNSLLYPETIIDDIIEAIGVKKFSPDIEAIFNSRVAAKTALKDSKK